jgi:hypothetical protein
VTTYKVHWVESWSREILTDVDEDALREWAGVPIGPIPARLFEVWLDEDGDHGYPWHPQTMPDHLVDEFYGLDVLDVR